MSHHEDYRAFIRRIRQLMYEKHISIDDFTQDMMISKHTAYNWLNFHTTMSGEDLLRAVNIYMGGKYDRERRTDSAI